MKYQDFANKYLGQRVCLDNNGSYQCVQLIKQYLRDAFNIPNGAYGNAIDYWTKTNPVILEKFSRTPTQSVQQGDIVVLNGLSGNPYGHVTIASGRVSGNTYEALEQNGATGNGSGTGGDAIRFRYITTSRIAGVLRPVTVSAPAAPAPVIGKRVYLPAVQSWRLYNEGGPYTIGTEKAKLCPAQYNGLNYAVLGTPVKDVVIIQTQMFGRGAIYVGNGTGAVIV